jgi:hypothetical protein
MTDALTQLHPAPERTANPVVVPTVQLFAAVLLLSLHACSVRATCLQRLNGTCITLGQACACTAAPNTLNQHAYPVQLMNDLLRVISVFVCLQRAAG